MPVGAETGGLVATAVYVDEGSYVRQGQPLVQLNDALLRAQLRQQQAAVQTAEANAARDDAALDRVAGAEGDAASSARPRWTRPWPTSAPRAANLAAARASLSETQTRLSQATMRAPVAGLIISRSVTKGQIVAAGTELFRMVRDGRLELDAQVPETELALVRAGQIGDRLLRPGRPDAPAASASSPPRSTPQTRLGVARIALSAAAASAPACSPAPTSTSAPSRRSPCRPPSVLYRENQAGRLRARRRQHASTSSP